MTRPVLAGSAALGLICVALDRVLGHVAASTLVGVVVSLQFLLAVGVAVELRRASTLARGLRKCAKRVTISGTVVSPVPGLGPRAFVLGVRRPEVFVGDGLIDALSPSQMRAVLAHELAHVADRAPLRLAALATMRRVLPVAAVACLIDRRLAEIECRADEAAVAAGATPADLAAALLRVEAFPEGAGMSLVRGPRVAALAAMAAGHRRDPELPTPAAVEWWLLVALWAAVPICLAAAFIGRTLL